MANNNPLHTDTLVNGLQSQWHIADEAQLNITEKEWAAAQQIKNILSLMRLDKPTKVSLKPFKKHFPELNHSLILMPTASGRKIGMISKNKATDEGILGYGSTGVVKIVQWEDGTQSVLKIEPQRKNNNLDIQQMLNQYQGDFLRPRPEKTPWIKSKNHTKEDAIKNKQYTLYQKVEGQSLDTYLKNNTPNALERCQLLINAASSIKKLHDDNLIHCDIQPGNLMVTHDLNIEAIDFSNLHHLDKNQQNIVLNKKIGSRSTMAPEVGVWKGSRKNGHWVSQDGIISKASDVYSLGQVFKKHIPLQNNKLYDRLIKKMTHAKPEQRITIDQVLVELNKIHSSVKNSSHKTQAATTISFSQALLILIEHYNTHDKNYAAKLKQLYTLGFNTPEDHKIIDYIKTDPLLKAYDISDEYNVIANDASRRYFETHLSFETMKKAIQDYPLDLIQQHFDSIKSCFEELGGDIDFQKFKKTGEKVSLRNYEKEIAQRKNDPETLNHLIKGISKAEQKAIDDLFSGKIPDINDKKYQDSMYMEYADMINRIQTLPYLNEQDKEKALLIVKSTRLAMILSNKIDKYAKKGTYQGDPIPGENIYKSGIYLPHNRGRIDNNSSMPEGGSHRMGLLHPDMPLDINDEAYAEVPYPYHKPSDKSTFVEGSEWVKKSMDQKVHTFSNSISGTLLAQLRLMLKLNKENKLAFNKKALLEQHFKSMISLMTYISGGHSLNEFSAPLQLEATKDAFNFIKDFDKINLESLFYRNNQPAYEAAINKTIEYNKKYLELLSKEKQHLLYEVDKCEDKALFNQYKQAQREFNPLAAFEMENKLSNFSHLSKENILQPIGLITLMQSATKKSAQELVTFKPLRALLHHVAAFVTACIQTFDEAHRNQLITKIVDELAPFITPILDFDYQKLQARAIKNIQKISNGEIKGKKVYRDALNEAKNVKLPSKFYDGIHSHQELAVELALSKLANREFEKTIDHTLMEYIEQHPELKMKETSEHPFVLFASGGQGSGKGSSIDQLLNDAKALGYNPQDFVYLNNDSFKPLLKNAQQNPKQFSQMTHTEARLIRDKAKKLAQQRGLNLLLDQVNPSQNIINYAANAQGTAKGVVVSTRVDEALERSFLRGINTQRFEDTQTLLACHQALPQTVLDNIKNNLNKNLSYDFIDNNDSNGNLVQKFMTVDCQSNTIVVHNTELLKRFIQKQHINLNAKTFDELYELDKISDGHLAVAANKWLDSLSACGFSVTHNDLLQRKLCRA